MKSNDILDGVSHATEEPKNHKSHYYYCSIRCKLLHYWRVNDPKAARDITICYRNYYLLSYDINNLLMYTISVLCPASHGIWKALKWFRIFLKTLQKSSAFRKCVWWVCLERGGGGWVHATHGLFWTGPSVYLSFPVFVRCTSSQPENSFHGFHRK